MLHRTRAAFTLVELLVAIGIIVILIGILIPTVQSVRQSAWDADTKNTISQISAAINQYYLQHNAYPGPFGNEELRTCRLDGSDVVTGADWQEGNITMTENLTLGLLGGLVVAPGPTLKYDEDSTRQSRGPFSLNTANPKRYPALLTATERMLSKGLMADSEIADMTDSAIPEFLDGWPEGAQLPLIYLRAKSGAPGVVSVGTNQAQYDLGFMKPYLRDGKDGPTGVGTAPIGKSAADNGRTYFAHPSVPDTPREKNRFVLIAAGKDRIFGTQDDVASWGDR